MGQRPHAIVVLALGACILALTAPAIASFIEGDNYYAPGTPLPSDFVVGPTSPGKWGGATMGSPGGTVTWSLSPTGTVATAEGVATLTHLSAFMPAGFHAQIVAAFNAWSAVANIQFVEVTDNGAAFNAAGAVGDIRLGGHAFDGAGGTLAHGYYPPVNGTSAAGDIHFDTGDTWKLAFGGGGFSIFQVAAHEIGHAIGLDHTGVASSLMNPFYTEAFSGPQADDIAGGQFIYGAAVIPEPASLSVLFIAAVATLRQRRTAA